VTNLQSSDSQLVGKHDETGACLTREDASGPAADGVPSAQQALLVAQHYQMAPSRDCGACSVWSATQTPDRPLRFGISYLAPQHTL
jgi:hypothetical protein